MTVRITDRNCFMRLSMVEGPEWVKDQLNTQAHVADDACSGQCTYVNALRAWAALKAEIDFPWGDDLIIYGRGGYNRYAVREATGVVYFIRSLARVPSEVQKAIDAGFDVM
jgi:hypothetical protein